MDYRNVRKTLVITLILNIVVSGAKGVVGAWAGSVSMVADAVHSFFDSVSNIVGLIAVGYSGMAPDREHPYGHGKYETMGALFVGGLLFLTAGIVAWEAYERFLSGAVPEITRLTVAVMLATIGINLGVTWYERRVGKKEGSAFLLADAKHTFSDVAVSASVLAGFLCIRLGYPAADTVVGLLIAVLIGRMGLEVVRDAAGVLIDTPPDIDDNAFSAIVLSTPGVVGYHDLRCRGKPGEVYCDLHVMVDSGITVREGHDIVDRVRDRLMDEYAGITDVLIHTDPADGSCVPADLPPHRRSGGKNG
ncbi:cation diffusion facilitator family transporter [Methanogenium sp. S4BF]|uniref:cation diffusion facilitator family transporter n=1 Tax=Methanogenium sp. S4BF TaxID=1789226 RepID=UPI002416690E|nr:cation diffusion facilitator family transporter [Methanogenium sp. S4BF]WFN34188.1 cation diffusion facilitator family transporter [Methanogenium sp. S4BF]